MTELSKQRKRSKEREKKKRINQKIESQWEDLNWKKKSLGLHPDLKKKCPQIVNILETIPTESNKIQAFSLGRLHETSSLFPPEHFVFSSGLVSIHTKRQQKSRKEPTVVFPPSSFLFYNQKTFIFPHFFVTTLNWMLEPCCLSLPFKMVFFQLATASSAASYIFSWQL